MIHKILGRLASVRLFVFATLALASFAASAFDTPYLTFRSASQFRLSGTSSRWSSGTLDIATSNPTDEASWTKGWTGTQVTAVQTDGQYYIYLRGTGITTFGGSSYYGSPFSLSGAMDNVYCEGDIETLRGYNGDVLAMGEYCYRYMFSGWNKLVSAPTLSATTLANYCYQGMFNGCSSLTAPPALPATTLFNSCYSSMFQNCTALKSLPTLPATSSATSCYSSMFDGCESLEVNTEGPGVEWSIPSGFGSAGTMFSNTGGTFTGSPTAGKTYFVASALPFGEIYQVPGSGALGVALVGYSTSIDLSSTVKNGTVPYTFTFSSGTLPPEMVVSGSTLSGTPTTAGNYEFSLSVTDSTSHPASVLSYSLRVLQPAIVETAYVGGSTPSVNCIQLTTDMTTLDQEWYVASGALNFGTGGIKVSGNVNLVLADGASVTVQGASKKAGVNVAYGNTLTIYGQTDGTGRLTASGNSSDGNNHGGAGIGGNEGENGGTVTINGGVIVATGGGYNGAGIGGGRNGNGGTVLINGGTITASAGSWYGAGIGGGYYGLGGTVTINGGTVTATGGSQQANTENGANGIGRGYHWNTSASRGTLTVGPTVSVKAGATANPTAEIGRGGAITIGTQRYFYVETLGLVQETSALSAYTGETKNWNLADTITGGTTPYLFTPVSGFEPPTDLTLVGTALSGSVAAAGTYTIKYTVTDSSATPLELEAVYTLTVTAPDPLSASTDLGKVKVGKAKDFSLADTISGGVPPYAFGYTGSLPTGFSLSGSTLSFTTAAAGNYACEITVTDQLGTTISPSPVYTVEAIESAGFIDDDPEEPETGDSVDCLTPDGVFPRTCNQVTDSSTTVTWDNSWYYVTGNVTLSAGVTVVGKVSLILCDSATLTVNSEIYKAGINVSDGSSLTVYSQSGGTGALTTKGGLYGAGIGGSQNESAGTINIYGGSVTSTGGSNAAGIGGGKSGSVGSINIYGGNIVSTGGFYGAALGGGAGGDGGNVTISGGMVSATGYFSPGIGAGNNGVGGAVIINGGTVNASGGEYSGYPGIGANGSYAQGTLTVGANVVVKAGVSATLTDSDIKNPGGETSIPLTTKYQYYLIEKQGPAPLTQDTSAFVAHVGEAFEQALAGTVSGGTSPYSFTLKSQTLSEKGLSYSDGVISGTPTATGSATVTVTVSDSATGSDHQSEDFTYTVTITYPPKSITYIDSSDGTTELTGLEPAEYTPGTATLLPATVPAASAPNGYEFEGWYLTSACDGTKVTSISAEATTPQTFYANWTPIEYSISYMEDAYTQYPGVEPSKYTVEDAVVLPADAVAQYGYEFDGWYTTSALTGSRVTTIPKGSTGPKTFYAKWIVAPVDATYIDADGTPQTEKCTPVDTTSTTLAEGWYVASGTVSIPSTVTVSGDVKLVLEDGCSLTVAGSSNKAGINVPTGSSLTIYAQANGTGSLTATGGSYGAGIGGNSGESCGAVTIYGGNVTARSNAMYGSGIGGGQNGNGGTVTIYGGTIVAQAMYTSAYGAGIGGGGSSSSTSTVNGGTVAIYGGTVTAESKYRGAGIGGGYYNSGATVTISGGTVTATAGSYNTSASYIANGIGKGYGNPSTYTTGTLTIGANMKAYAGSSANPTTELGSTRSYRYYLVKAAPLAQSVSAIEANVGEPCNIDLSATVLGGSGTYTFELKSGSELPSGLEINGTALSGTVANIGTYVFTLVVTDTTAPTPQTIDAEYTLTVKLPGFIDEDPVQPTSDDAVSVDCRNADGVVRKRMCHPVTSSDTAVTWDNSWYYVTGDVTLSAGVTVVGKVSLVLADDATLTVTGGSSTVAGINVTISGSVTNSLTIYGQTKGNGALTVTAGGDNGAGIGGGSSQKGGKVNVYGGAIKATGGYYGSGIGGGRNAAGGVVNVYGGTIEATAGDVTSTPKPVGIGNGYNNTAKGDFYVFNEDMTVKAGSSATASLTKLMPNATTHKVTVSTYKYFIVTGPLPMSQRTASLGTARTGELKSWTLATSTSTSYIQDGNPPYTFEPENSTIPEGFSLTSAGVLSGRPSSAGNYEFDIAVTDSNPSSTNFTFTLTVSDPNPITMSTGLDLGTRTKGQSYTKTLSASGGVPSLTYAVVDGTFPPGLNLGTGGYISGSTTTAGDYNFTVRVTDSALPANTADFEFHMFVKDVYAITYYDTDGEPISSLQPATYVETEGVASLPTPVKDGYRFFNWYDNADFYGAPVTEIPATSKGPINLYAKWYVPVSGDIPVTFTGADGEQTETCTVIDPGMAAYDSAVHYNNTSSNITLSSGWYVVANIDTLPQKVSIVINGEVNLVLMDDRSLTVTKPAYHKSSDYLSAIVLTSGNTLNIYGQTKGTGTLTANGFNGGAGIGGCAYNGKYVCGTLRVYGGMVVANGGSSGAPGIGGGAHANGAGGTVEIHGGTVTATGANGGAGIGGGGNLLANGIAADGGTVTITGGTVTAIGSAFSYSGPRVGAGAGIGGGGGAGQGGSGGTVEIYGGNVTAIGGVNESASAAGIGGGNGADSEGTLKVSGQYAVVYAGDDASSATERTPGANDMVALDGSPYYEIQGEGAAPVEYSITYMSAGVEQTWLEPNQYTHGFAQELATPDPREGYTFDGWFDNDQCLGDPVSEISASDSGDKILYAGWTPVEYSITYYSVVGDETTELTELAPATYTIESGATLPTEISVEREGWVFDGWSSYVSGPAVATIPVGTMGDKKFYTRWDVADFGQFEGELFFGDAGDEGEFDLTETIHKGTKPYAFELKSGELPDGVELSSDGTLSGTPTAAGLYEFVLTVTDSSEPQKVIDATYTLEVQFKKAPTDPLDRDAVLYIGYPADVSLTQYLSGGTWPYQVALDEGSVLPPGLKLNGNRLVGTPTFVGTSNFILKVSDANDVTSYLWYTVYSQRSSAQESDTVNGIDWSFVSASPPKVGSRLSIWNSESLTSDGQNAISIKTAGCVYVPDGSRLWTGNVPVTCIGRNAFKGCDKITRMTLPDTITDIGENAFDGCTSLKAVVIPSSGILEHINTNAFTGATSLEHIYVGKGDKVAFTALLETSGYEVTDENFIVECDFYNLTLDTNFGDELDMPVLTKAYTETLYLPTVGNLPVPTRKDYTFEGWYTEESGGTRINEDDTLSGGDWTLYAHWSTTLPDPVFTVNWKGEITDVTLNGHTEVVVPETVNDITVTAIGDRAFDGLRVSANKNLLRVVIPGTVENIGWRAFDECTKLREVNIPSGVTNIAQNAFRLCVSLESVDIPGSVENIGSSAFANCSNLVSVTIGNGVKTIGQSAFGYCTSLSCDDEEVGFYIPDSVTSIGSGAFHGVRFEKASLPGTLYSEGDPVGAQFSNVSTLTKITVTYRDLAIPVFKIINGSLRSVQLNGNTEVTIPDGVTEIFIDAFSGLSEMTSVTIPTTVTNIWANAFEDCSGLTEITIPDSVTRLSRPFRGCTGLKSLTVPDSVTDLDLWSCSNLVEVVVGSGVTEVAQNAFSSCTSLERVTFNGNLTWINQSAFWNCYALKEINFPDTLRYIGLFAFMNCTSLESVTIPKFVTVERHAFSGCTSLKQAKVGVEATTKKKALLAAPRRRLLGAAPETTTIGERAFSSCTKLEEVTLGSTVSDIGGGAFSGCPKLKSITVEAGNENYSSVNGLLLKGEGDLVSASGTATSINVPSGVTNILHDAFADYTTLTSVALPSGLTTIGEAAFSNATRLATATIPDGVGTIGTRAFYGTDLKTVCVESPGYIDSLRTKISGSGYNTTGVSFFAPSEALPSVEKPLEEADNGLQNWQNYVLNQDSKEPVKVEGVSATTATSVSIASTLNAPAGVSGFTVKYSIDQVSADGAVVSEGEKQTSSALSIDLESITTNAFFTMKATIINDATGAEVPVTTENVIGVLAITNAPATTIIGVPFKSLADDGSISVSNLVQTVNLSEGDELKAFDADGKLHSWTLTDGAWVPDYVSGGTGTEMSEDADKIKLARGKGVWLTRKDPTKPIYFVGEASVEAAETELDVATDEAPKAWNMVAPPSVEPVKLNDVFTVDDGSTIQVPPAREGGIPRNYTFKNGKWGYDGSENGIPKRIESDTLPPGRGFWYINKSKDPNKKINW